MEEKNDTVLRIENFSFCRFSREGRQNSSRVRGCAPRGEGRKKAYDYELTYYYQSTRTGTVDYFNLYTVRTYGTNSVKR
jgi:hypothetical protein